MAIAQGVGKILSFRPTAKDERYDAYTGTFPEGYGLYDLICLEYGCAGGARFNTFAPRNGYNYTTTKPLVLKSESTSDSQFRYILSCQTTDQTFRPQNNYTPLDPLTASFSFFLPCVSSFQIRVTGSLSRSCGDDPDCCTGNGCCRDYLGCVTTELGVGCGGWSGTCDSYFSIDTVGWSYATNTTRLGIARGIFPDYGYTYNEYIYNIGLQHPEHCLQLIDQLSPVLKPYDEEYFNLPYFQPKSDRGQVYNTYWSTPANRQKWRDQLNSCGQYIYAEFRLCCDNLAIPAQCPGCVGCQCNGRRDNNITIQIDINNCSEFTQGPNYRWSLEGTYLRGYFSPQDPTYLSSYFESALDPDLGPNHDPFKII